MNRLRWALAIGICAALAAQLMAHEGHEHRVMGTVTKAEKSRIEVQTTEGKTVGILLDHDTKYYREQTPAGAEDVKVGTRVVITTIEKQNGMILAKKVSLGTSPSKAEAYTCPMHPEIVRDKPGKCPKCGMDLKPKG